MIKVKLGELCEIINGYAFKSEDYVGAGIRVIRITNVQKGFIEDKQPQFFPIEKKLEIEKYILKENDLLISLTGNVGRVALLDAEYLPAALNQRVACLRIKDDRIQKSFLYHFLNSDYFEKQCIASSKGIAQKNMSTEWLKKYDIPLFSTEEQIKIVNILDKLNGVIHKHKEIYESMQDLVRLRFVELFGNPIQNPMSWNEKSLGECLDSIDNGKSFVCDNVPRTEDKPAVLKLSAATYGFYQPDENKAMLDESDFVDKAEVHKGDLLFTRKNTPELVGMSAYVFETPEKLMMPDLIFRLNTKDIINKIYLWQLINHELFRSKIQALAGGSAKSMSNISKERLLKLKVPVPPMELQKQFAEFVEQVEKAKAVIKEQLAELETLKKSLMQKYFG